MAVQLENSEKKKTEPPFIDTEGPTVAIVKKVIRFEANLIECLVTKNSIEFKVEQLYFWQC
jgi:hypothetical protein